jgi:integrase
MLPEVIEFTSETGLRRGEVFNLTWTSVDLRRGAVRVEMQLRGRVVNGVAWRPKHNKWREVPLSEKALAVLKGLRKEAVGPAQGLVFPNRGGSPYERMDRAPDAAGKGYFPDAVEAAGLKGRVTFHSLRHLFAVRLLTRGVPITVVSELLGHSDINLTVKRYGRFSSDAKVKWDAVKVLDARPVPPAP